MRIRRLGRAIRASLQGDRKRRAETAGQDVETLLGEDPPNPKEAWRRLSHFGGCLRSAPKWEQTSYIIGRRNMPL